MIIQRDHFEINGRCVIEKLVVGSTITLPVHLPQEACFIHFKSTNATINGSTVCANNSQNNFNVFVNCGNYLTKLSPLNTQSTSEIIVIHLYKDLIQEIYQNDFLILNTFDNYSQTYLFNNEEIISNYIESLELYFKTPSLFNKELIVLKIKELIVLLINCGYAQNLEEVFTKMFSKKVHTLTEVVTTHLYSNINIEQLAWLAGMSLSTFKREFQKTFNDSPSNYLKKKRISEALKLLTYTDLSVSEICFKVGFEDLSNFGKIFKKLTNLSPAQCKNTPKEILNQIYQSLN